MSVQPRREPIAIVADEPLPRSIWPGHETTPVAAALVLGQDAGGGADLASAPPLAILEEEIERLRGGAAAGRREP